MTEKLLQNKKNGMPILLAILAGYVVAILVVLWAAGAFGEAAVPENLSALTGVLMAVCVAWLCLGWILACGLKVLRPQEALVLTLFGNYIGTLKGEGFYYVNPLPPVVQRLPVQPGGDRHLGVLALRGHCQGGVQRGQL